MILAEGFPTFITFIKFPVSVNLSYITGKLLSCLLWNSCGLEYGKSIDVDRRASWSRNK